MITFLADHNIEGQALSLWGLLAKEGWLELISIQLVTFRDIGLSFESSDREVWRFAQANKMIILTDNRIFLFYNFIQIFPAMKEVIDGHRKISFK